MTNIKQTLGESTEQIENQAKEYFNKLSPNYTNLEPYQRGLILLGMLGLTIFTIYWLVKEDQDKIAQRKAKQEAQAEERLIKRMELLKRLKE